jgi:MFS family permease
VAAVGGTRLAVRIGNKAVVAAGLSLFGLALLWIATNTASTSYLVIAAQMVFGGGGMGLITAPATEAILGVVPKEKAGVGSAVNDATRLFGSALGVAVIGSIAASVYASHIASAVHGGLPAPAAVAAKGSLGGALIAAHALHQAGLSVAAQHLTSAATRAFLHSLAAGCEVAGSIALLGALMALSLLPSRPAAQRDSVEQTLIPAEAVAA